MTANRSVLFVIHYPVFGGPHNQALRLQAPLAERGWDQVVLLPDEPGNAAGRLRTGGVHVSTASFGRLRAARDPRTLMGTARGFRTDVERIREQIRAHRADLVMIGGLVNPHAAVAARLEGVPLVWQIVDTRAPMPLRRVLAPVVARAADSILCTGSAVADAHPGLARARARTRTFFPPVDTDLFQADAEARARARAELRIGPEDTVVGMVGNVNPQKGQGTFVRAAARLRQSVPGARYVILGASYPQHAAYESAMLAQADAAGLLEDHGLQVLDPGERVSDLAQAFDVAWLTSEPRSEGIPTVVEEAMALSLPVVASDVGAVREAVADGESGYVVPPRDPSALAAATRRILQDPALRDRLARAARRRAVELFGIGRCADVHVEAFDLAVAHAEGRRAAKTYPEFESPPRPPGWAHAAFRCPRCHGALTAGRGQFHCAGCGARYAEDDGMAVLLPPPSQEPAPDGQKHGQIAFFDDEVDPGYELSRPAGSPGFHGRLLEHKYLRGVAQLSLRDRGLATALVVCGGSGMDAEFLARSGLSVISADLSPEAARRASSRAAGRELDVISVVADAEQLPFADASIDVVYVHDGLHHLEDPFLGLAEMARVARHGVVITEPAAAAVTRTAVTFGLALEVEEAGNRVARLEPEEVARFLEARGFAVLGASRYAMYYAHEPGWPSRMLSRERLLPVAWAAYRVADRLVGRWGNKMTLTATRRT